MTHPKITLALIAAAGALVPLAADDRFSWRNDRYETYRSDSYHRGNAFIPGDRYRVDPVTAALRDLSGIFRRSRVDAHEADHFRDAMRDLENFRARADRGLFDRRSLDGAIDEMRDLARAHQLHPRDREIIARHMAGLRSLRDHGFRRY